MFLVYVVGLHIPVPFIKPDALKSLLQGMLGFIDILAGGALGGATGKLSILALGIIPYINASIIMQLLGIAVPQIQRMQKEGEGGRKKLSEYTRWGTVVLALIQATGLGIYLKQSNMLDTDVNPIVALIVVVLVMAAGTSFLMWVGEQITDKGIGNGVSLIIFGGIMMRLPDTMIQMFRKAADQPNIGFAIVTIALLVAVFVAIVGGITWVQQAVRQIPVQHAKRVVGSRAFSSANTYLPLKVVTAGVIPIIFAISVVMLPGQLAGFLAQNNPGAWWIEAMRIVSPGYSGTTLLVNGIAFGQIIGAVLYFALVVFFTYFYTAVVYNVQDIADNLKKQGSFVPGLRPGKQTEKYIDMVLTRITFAGAIFLGVVALLPYIIPALLHSASGGSAQSFALWGGTSLLIVVGVALETMKQLEAHLVMRHYDGFIKSSR
jgi:preprotein translocase subunit SecY